MVAFHAKEMPGRKKESSFSPRAPENRGSGKDNSRNREKSRMKKNVHFCRFGAISPIGRLCNRLYVTTITLASLAVAHEGRIGSCTRDTLRSHDSVCPDERTRLKQHRSVYPARESMCRPVRRLRERGNCLSIGTGDYGEGIPFDKTCTFISHLSIPKTDCSPRSGLLGKSPERTQM